MAYNLIVLQLILDYLDAILQLDSMIEVNVTVYAIDWA
jgi:hypothetical protein